MITELLAALSAIPKIADSLDRLAGTVAQLNARADKARAAKRRGTKDDEVEARIAALVDTSPSRMPEREAGAIVSGSWIALTSKLRPLLRRIG